jgi:hypothetical protein
MRLIQGIPPFYQLPWNSDTLSQRLLQSLDKCDSPLIAIRPQLRPTLQTYLPRPSSSSKRDTFDTFLDFYEPHGRDLWKSEGLYEGDPAALADANAEAQGLKADGGRESLQRVEDSAEHERVLEGDVNEVGSGVEELDGREVAATSRVDREVCERLEREHVPGLGEFAACVERIANG